MRTTYTSAVVAAVLLGAAGASAQSISQITGKLPLAQADRPLTMTESTLRIDADFRLARACFDAVDAMGTPTSVCATGTFVDAGAGFSIIDDFEVGANVVPLQLTDDFDYGDPSLYARFRFISGSLEMAAEVSAAIGTDSVYDFLLRPGLPIRLPIGDASLRLDTGAYLPITFADDTTLGLQVPLTLTINATPNVFLGPRTGLHILDLDAAGDTMAIPLGAWVGFTIPAGESAPLADLWVAFDWPLFLTPGADDAVNANLYQLTVGVNVFVGGR